MPAFQDLLTQLSSEYERVESDLADALAELRACRVRDVRAGTCASLTSSGFSTGDNLFEATGSSGHSLLESTGSQAGRQLRLKQLQDSVDDEEEEEDQDWEECERDRSWSPEPTQVTVEGKLDPVAEDGPGLALFRGGLFGSIFESTSSEDGSEFRLKHVHDAADEEEEEEEDRDVMGRGRSRSPEPALVTVEETLTIEPAAEEEGLVREVCRGAAAKVFSNSASGPLGRAPTEGRIANCSHDREHRSSKLSVRLPLAIGSPEGAMRCQATPESARTQDTLQTTMKLNDHCSPCPSISSIAEPVSSMNKRDGHEEETARRSGRSRSQVQFTIPQQPQEVRALMTQVTQVRAQVVRASSNELRMNGLCSDDSKPVMGRRSIRDFQLGASRWVINPEHSNILEKWDQITIAALAYVALVTPVQVSMLESKMDAMLVVNCVIDSIFFLDMILQFFLMYPRQRNGVYSLEHRHPKIIAHYLKTWFFLDIVSNVPFDMLAALSNSGGAQRLKVVKTVRLMRLLKLTRVLKASRVLNRLEIRMSITYGRLALLKFFVILFVITHWLANLWALTLVIVDESEGLPRWVDALTALEDNVEVKTKDSPAKLYVACLYFTSYTITSVGYGDIGPKNISERVVLTFMVMVSGISWAVVLGQVCGIVASLDKEEQAFRSTMDELNAMMHDRLIQGSLRTRLRSFFLSNRTAQKKALQLNIMSAMSPGLRAEVSWEINRDWLHKVRFLRPFLEETPERQDHSLRPFVLDMSMMMEQAVCAQSESFGVPHTMYILNRGLVGRLSRLLRSGAAWGSDFVLSDLRLLEPVDSYALTYVELTTLDRERFLDLVQRHSTDFPEIYLTVRRFCCWLAFQRAFMLEAKRRQALLRRKSREAMACRP